MRWRCFGHMPPVMKMGGGDWAQVSEVRNRLWSTRFCLHAGQRSGLRSCCLFQTAANRPAPPAAGTDLSYAKSPLRVFVRSYQEAPKRHLTAPV